MLSEGAWGAAGVGGEGGHGDPARPAGRHTAPAVWLSFQQNKPLEKPAWDSTNLKAAPGAAVQPLHLCDAPLQLCQMVSGWFASGFLVLGVCAYVEYECA